MALLLSNIGSDSLGDLVDSLPAYAVLGSEVNRALTSNVAAVDFEVAM